MDVPLTNPDSGLVLDSDELLVLDSVEPFILEALVLVSWTCRALAELRVLREWVEPLKSSIISEPGNSRPDIK